MVASASISGASADNTGGKTSIVQRLNNADTLLHSVIYTIVPRIYGKCDLPALTSTVWVNPAPEIRIYANDTIICNGETTRIVMRNPNTVVRGRWTYDLIVVPDEAIRGSSVGGTFTQTLPLNETLFNSSAELHKVVYRFIPHIDSDDGLHSCNGTAGTVTIWVRPGITYIKKVSDFNGYNISCYRRSDGFIRINPSEGSAPLTYRWRGPQGFESTDDYVRQLSAGRYDVTLTDRNRCSVIDSVNLTEPAQLGMNIDRSISTDGAFNINCANGKTGSIDVSAINSVGFVRYMWNDGVTGNVRTGLPAGDYRIVLTDANSCVADSTVTLIQPDELKTEAAITQPFCPDKPDGIIKLDVTGGVRGTDYSYKWENSNSIGSSLENITAGVYNVTVTDVNGCSLSTKHEVAPINAMCLIIPEAISPNNDMVNDVWNIGNTDLYPKMEIMIYNRWGQFLWKSEEGYPHPWDGKSRGRVLPMDSYHYVIDLHNGSDPFMGTITIVK
jgi:gliding motility-associated-like protein